jgi:hypothetical protein
VHIGLNCAVAIYNTMIYVYVYVGYVYIMFIFICSGVLSDLTPCRVICDADCYKSILTVFLSDLGLRFDLCGVES